MTKNTYQTWLDTAIATLSQSGDSEAKIDAFCLLSFVTGKNRASLVAFGETELTDLEVTQLDNLLARRLTGEPLAYILGERAFWSLDLAVAPSTLIPRADTEVLVEKALALAEKKIAQGQLSLAILDLGTGTGAIALALAKELYPQCQKKGIHLSVMGVDFQADAVDLAKGNAERNGLADYVEFKQSDWFKAVEGQFDIIVSNPPYIDERDPHLSQGDVRFEPKTALVAANEGYADLFHLIDYSPKFLKAEGWLLMEHGFEQARKVQEYFAQRSWQHIETIRDYAGLDRVTLAQII